MCRGAPWDPQLLPRAVQTHGFPVKTRGVFFTEMEQTVLKFVWNHQGPQRARAVLREGRDWRHHAPRFQAVPRGRELEEARPRRAGLKPHRGRSAEQTGEPGGKPGVKGRSTYNRGAETTQREGWIPSSPHSQKSPSGSQTWLPSPPSCSMARLLHFSVRVGRNSRGVSGTQTTARVYGVVRPEAIRVFEGNPGGELGSWRRPW